MIFHFFTVILPQKASNVRELSEWSPLYDACNCEDQYERDSELFITDVLINSQTYA